MFKLAKMICGRIIFNINKTKIFMKKNISKNSKSNSKYNYDIDLLQNNA